MSCGEVVGEMWGKEWVFLFFSVGGCFRRIRSEEGMVDGGGVECFWCGKALRLIGDWVLQ